MKTYTSYQNDIPRIINNSASDNLTWATEMIMDSIRYLIAKYYFNERSYTVATVASTQFYNLPPLVKKLINVTVTIGGVVWQPKECPSRQMWDSLNVITFTQDFPSYFFVYNGQVGIYPTPSSSSNTITMNYKTRVPELSQIDYTTGTVAITTNTTAVTGSGTTWTKAMAQGGWLRVSHSGTDAANGDNQWYEIASVTDGTHLVLKNNYTGATVTGASYIIGEVSILPEDYQDLPLYRMGLIYYTTRFPDPIRASMYQKLWDIGEEKLNEEFGAKTSSIVLNDTETIIQNPNLFVRSVS